jgi:hypothetical protein
MAGPTNERTNEWAELCETHSTGENPVTLLRHASWLALCVCMCMCVYVSCELIDARVVTAASVFVDLFVHLRPCVRVSVCICVDEIAVRCLLPTSALYVVVGWNRLVPYICMDTRMFNGWVVSDH